MAATKQTAPKVMSGARAKLNIVDPNSGTTHAVGLFNNASYHLTYETAPAFVLGRFAAVEVDYTSQDLIPITCSGFRVIDHGPWAECGLPKLQDLLLSEYLTLDIYDRQAQALGDTTAKPIAHFKNVRCTGFQTTISARSLEELTVSFVAIGMDDESAINAENATAPDWPSSNL
jgi:hypothetical protein